MTGYFAPDSMAVRVMSTRAVGLTYGKRALVIGAVHPRLFVGTVEHTTDRQRPYNRLVLTAKLFEAVFLGTTEEADRALAFTQRAHQTVSGALTEDAGPHYPAGTPYSALDPHLMFMTMAFAFDSVEVMHDLLVRRLTAAERESLYQDFVRWGELFGMPRSAAPASHAVFRASFDAYLDSGKPYLTDQARVVGSYLAGVKRADYAMPPPLRPLFGTLDLIVMGSLPASVRRLYGFRWSPAHEAAFRGAVRSARLMHMRPPRLVPRPLDPILHGPNYPLFKVIAEAEKRHLKRGRLSMPEAMVDDDSVRSATA
jgi:uncharacterized protein (DUF2236 family)